MSEAVALEVRDDGVLLPVRAQPKARRSGLNGVHDGRLRVQVTEAPEKGKANDAVVRVLASELGLKRRQVTLTGGAASSQKTFLVAGTSVAELRVRLSAALDAS